MSILEVFCHSFIYGGSRWRRPSTLNRRSHRGQGSASKCCCKLSMWLGIETSSHARFINLHELMCHCRLLLLSDTLWVWVNNTSQQRRYVASKLAVILLRRERGIFVFLISTSHVSWHCNKLNWISLCAIIGCLRGYEPVFGLLISD